MPVVETDHRDFNAVIIGIKLCEYTHHPGIWLLFEELKQAGPKLLIYYNSDRASYLLRTKERFAEVGIIVPESADLFHYSIHGLTNWLIGYFITSNIYKVSDSWADAAKYYKLLV